MSSCPHCSYVVADHIAECPRCNTRVGYPNVIAARGDAPELAKRAVAARDRAKVRGAEAALLGLQTALDDSKAVVNVDGEFLLRLLTDDKLLYGPYAKLLAAGVRLPADPARDRERTAVEGTLFGSWGGEIAYAALALDGRGLGTYGPASMELVPVAVAHRSSVLEENSYRFVDRHGFLPSQPVPPGYRAPWETRSEVGVAKLADRVEATTTSNDHATLVLSSDGVDRHKDEFIEVHIHGSFNRSALQKITLLEPPKDPAERHRLKGLKKEAKRLRIEWAP